jgi:hypothetical protein
MTPVTSADLCRVKIADTLEAGGGCAELEALICDSSYRRSRAPRGGCLGGFDAGLGADFALATHRRARGSAGRS